MRRRDFFRTVAGAAVAAAAPSILVAADGPTDDLKITRVTALRLRSKRPKFVGKNAFRDDHGEFAQDRILRIATDAGIEGIGWSSASREQCQKLLGETPLHYFVQGIVPGTSRIGSPLGSGSMPLWDLIGKALDQPVWKLLGAKGPDPVPVYDGSIYFVDLLPQYASNWRDRFREEIDMGLERGHRFFKVKIGRGKKWMPRAEGDARDVEVVRLIARHGGDGVGIGVDANNGYDREGAEQFVLRVDDVPLAFVEEMFPETIEECLRFKEFLGRRGLPEDRDHRTLLADGESAAALADLEPFIKAEALDVLQADMNRFGIDGIMAEAALAAKHGLLVAPHNWGSVLGFYAQLHVGRAVPNFYRAEQDPAESDVLIADNYRIKDGTVRVPETPGFGLTLDEKRLGNVPVEFDLRA